MTGEPRPWERAEHRLHRRHRSLARPTVTRANRRWQVKQRRFATSTEWVPSQKILFPCMLLRTFPEEDGGRGFFGMIIFFEIAHGMRQRGQLALSSSCS